MQTGFRTLWQDAAHPILAKRHSFKNELIKWFRQMTEITKILSFRMKSRVWKRVGIHLESDGK